MKHNSIHRSGLFWTGLLYAVLLATAPAQLILQDAFTDANGTAITAHAPNTGPSGVPYTVNSTSGDISSTIQSNVLTMVNHSSSSLSLSGVSLPSQLTLSAKVSTSMGTLGSAMTGSAGSAWNGIALGFSSAPTGGQNFFNFTGLVLNNFGALSLIHFDGAFGSTLYGSTTAYSLGTYDATAFHALTMTIDTGTGAVTGVSLTDNLGTQNYTFSGTPFATAGRLNYFSTYVQDGTNNNTHGGRVEDLSLAAAVPEPSTYVLLGMGLGFLFFLRSTKRRAV